MSLNRVSPLRILIPVFAVIALIAVGFSVRSVLRYNEPVPVEQLTLDPEESPVLMYQPGTHYVVQTHNEHLQLQVPFGTEAEIDFCGVKKIVGSGFHTITVED